MILGLAIFTGSNSIVFRVAIAAKTSSVCLGSGFCIKLRRAELVSAQSIYFFLLLPISLCQVSFFSIFFCSSSLSLSDATTPVFINCIKQRSYQEQSILVVSSFQRLSRTSFVTSRSFDSCFFARLKSLARFTVLLPVRTPQYRDSASSRQPKKKRLRLTISLQRKQSCCRRGSQLTGCYLTPRIMNLLISYLSSLRSSSSTAAVQNHLSLPRGVTSGPGSGYFDYQFKGFGPTLC